MSLQSIHDRLSDKGVALQLPIGAENNFVGVIDLILKKAYKFEGAHGENRTDIEIPADMSDQVEEYRGTMMERIAENSSDELMEKYLEAGELTEEEIRKGLRQAVCENRLYPVYCGSSLKNVGVQLLLDAVVDFLPSPLDVPPVTGTNPKTEKEEARKADANDPTAALAFKIATDPFVGKLTFIRVYSGSLKSGSYIENATNGEKERVGRLVKLHANSREEVSEIQAGDIGAAIGLKATKTGDTLCDDTHPIHLEEITFAEPVISMAIEPKTKADQEKMGVSLQKLLEEDPTLRIKSDDETGQTIISGMGELHLDIILDRMRREFKVECNAGKPQVAYRETITKEVDHEEKYIKQTGGRGQYGHVLIKVTPREPGQGYEFKNSVVGGHIPREYIPAVDKGIKDTMSRGVLAGYPMVDIGVELYEGSYHDVDSSEMAFKICGGLAMTSACKKADPVLLEPIMKVEVVIPEEFLGDVMGDLNSRRGLIKETGERGTAKTINAEVPLATMFGYATSIRSLTQGRANFTMEFGHYLQVPKNVALEIVKERTGA